MSAHDEYFTRLQSALQSAGDGAPSLVLDLPRVDANADRVRALWPEGHALRIAVKSLPVLSLVDRLMRRAGTRRLMVFHPAHLRPIFDRFSPDGALDVLFGKPVPARAVSLALDALSDEERSRVRWLADDPARVRALSELARARSSPVRVALEVDIGLHRGGFSSPAELASVRDDFAPRGPLVFAGLMGYDGHLGRIPWPLQRIPRSHQRSMEKYRAFRDAVAGFEREHAVYNAGGSLSFMEYRAQDPTDELTVGSCLVKPSHFDDARIAALECAAWIAAPVLKRVERFVPPEGEFLSGFVPLVKGLRGPGVFLFGGRYEADPVSPTDLVANLALGDSANQALYQLDQGSDLRVDDWAFFRPRESEATIDRFAHALAWDGARALLRWPTLKC